MNLFKKFKISVLLHKHEYSKVLKETNFVVSKKAKDVDPDILRYQGIASFYNNNLYHSKMCFELLSESGNAKPNDFVFLAYMNARQNEKQEALNNWCKALEINKHNKYASGALEYVRSKGRDLNLLEDPTIQDFIPKEPTLVPFKRITIISILVIVAAVLAVVGLNVIPKKYNEYKSNRLVNRPELEKVVIEDYNRNIIESPKDINQQYSYSEKEIKDKFEKIKTLIDKNKAVDAQIMINEIRLSNASPAVKMKMDILQDMITKPDYGFFKNEVTYQDYDQNRPLYKDVYIMWAGRVTNMSLYKEQITFDLEIGNPRCV